MNSNIYACLNFSIKLITIFFAFSFKSTTKLDIIETNQVAKVDLYTMYNFTRDHSPHSPYLSITYFYTYPNDDHY